MKKFPTPQSCWGQGLELTQWVLEKAGVPTEKVAAVATELSHKKARRRAARRVAEGAKITYGTLLRRRYMDGLGDPSHN